MKKLLISAILVNLLLSGCSTSVETTNLPDSARPAPAEGAPQLVIPSE